MRWLISSDLHLSDRARDNHRFSIFKWLAKAQAKYDPQATFLLGDLTDVKDRHPATLVNRVVRGLKQLRPPLFILKGNHDYHDPNHPFFGFLSHIDGLHFITQATFAPPHFYLIPHCNTQAEFDRACGEIKPNCFHLMLHQTFTGAIAETGSRLSGLSLSTVEAKCPLGCWSGDVHKPQRVGPVTYVGAPYRIKFGDDFTPRVLLITNGVEKNLYFPTLYKWVLHIHDHEELLQNEDVQKGDHVKVTLELPREEAVDWAKHKQLILNACKQLGVECYGIDLKVAAATPKGRQQASAAQTPEEVFNSFCLAENLANNVKRAGLSLLKGEG